MQHTVGLSPFFLDGWLEFNRRTWGTDPVRIRHAPEGPAGPSIDAVLYLDKAGKVVRPGLDLYTPVQFRPTNRQTPSAVSREWLSVASLLVSDMRQMRLANTIRLSPEVSDVRPWQSAGFHASVNYTVESDFPFDFHLASKSVRKKIRRARSAGYSCSRTARMDDVMKCLRGTQRRQSIDHAGLDVNDLECGRDLLGEESFRSYVCYAPDGEPVGTKVVLHSPGSRAMAWVAGTEPSHLHAGVAPLLTAYAIQDVQSAGAIGLDFCGIDSGPIAAAKLAWGGRMVPFFAVEAYNARTFAKFVLGWHQYRKPRLQSRYAKELDDEEDHSAGVV